jgi:polar amino acid transport system substrate-binding protein
MWQKPIDAERRMALLGVGLLAGPWPFYAWSQGMKITVLTEEWAPYNYTENGVFKGFSVEVVQSIIQQANVDAQMQIYPSMRASNMLNTLPDIMFISMFRTPEREEKYKWIGPLDTGAISFYKKKGSPLQITSLEDAKKVPRIACRHGGLVFNTLKAAGFENLDASSTDGNSVYKKILLNRCDLGISDTPLGVKYLLKQMDYPTDALVQTPVKVVEFPLYIACSKDMPDAIISLWQKTLDAMKASGQYAKIHARYNS